ncbi:uncharacterized protein [Panulirus ornatus]|uniref:uncharacterized protein isoform X2 n=1 Tax=Panulirus ornatus TaxID=150431 RepID=UPI003A84CA0B
MTTTRHLYEATLIAKVKEHPHLYDIHHKDYKDARKCIQTWSDIANDIGCPGAWRVCKERWRTLRDVYVRNRKAFMVKDKVKKWPRWKFFDQMHFLNAYISHRPPDPDVNSAIPSHWVGPGDVETVLCEEENEASEAQEDNSNSAHEELMVTTVDGKPIKDEVVEWMDEDLEASDGVSSVEGEIRKLQHLPLDSLPIQIKNISGSQGRSRGPPTAKDQMAAVVKAIQHDKESVQTPETTSVHRYAAAAPDHILDEEEELFGRYIAAAIRKLSGKSKSLAKMRIQKVLFHLEQSDRESREEKTEKSSDKSSEPSSLHQEAA